MCELAVDLLEELTTPVQPNEVQPWVPEQPELQQRMLNDVRRTKQQSEELTTRFAERASTAMRQENQITSMKKQLRSLLTQLQHSHEAASRIPAQIQEEINRCELLLQQD